MKRNPCKYKTFKARVWGASKCRVLKGDTQKGHGSSDPPPVPSLSISLSVGFVIPFIINLGRHH